MPSSKENFITDKPGTTRPNVSFKPLFPNYKSLKASLNKIASNTNTLIQLLDKLPNTSCASDNLQKQSADNHHPFPRL